MKKVWIAKLTFLCFLLSNNIIFCLFEEKNIFALSSSLCGAFYGKQSPISIYYNPANISSQYKYNFYFSNTKLFDIEELTTLSVCALFCFDKLGNFGFLYNTLGFELYKENNIYLGYSRKFKNSTVGLSLKFVFLDINKYEEEQHFNLDLGINTAITDKFSCGFVIKNLDGLQKWLVVFTKLELLNRFFSYIDVIKTSTDYLFCRIGYEEIIRLKNIDTFFRLGVETATQKKPARYSVGVGINFDLDKFNLSFDFGYLVHNILGAQNLYSLGVSFINKPENSQVLKSTTTLKNKNAKNPKENSPQLPIDLNAATEKELMQLPLIGKKFAQKIIEYRVKVGSFTCVEQLLEIPRFGEKRLQKIKPSITVSLATSEYICEVSTQTLNISDKEAQKCNINQATFDELLDLGLDIVSAKNIIRYRKKCKKIDSFEQLYKIPSIDLNIIEKIKERIIFE